MPHIDVRSEFKCAEREVRYRHYVYPKLIAEGKKTEVWCRREIETMEAIADDYRKAVEAEQPAFFSDRSGRAAR